MEEVDAAFVAKIILWKYEWVRVPLPPEFGSEIRSKRCGDPYTWKRDTGRS